MKEENKPVAWMSPDWKFSIKRGKVFCIPLYTVNMQSYVLGFEEGRLQGQLESVLTDDEIITRYRELSDEEILDCLEKSDLPMILLSDFATEKMKVFARAILKKASEK